MFDLAATHPAVSTTLAWLSTYLLHSTLLLALAMLASRAWRSRHLLAEEAVWRIALFGPIATATLQIAAGYRPVFGALKLAVAPAIGAASFGSVAAMPTSTFGPIAHEPLQLAKNATFVSLSPAAWWVAAWALVAAALLLRLAFAYRSLSRRLDPRLEIVGGTPHRTLARLVAEAEVKRPVHLTCAHRLPVPVALGVLRGEIAVPPRALSHLDAAEQESLLAHELAHLARRDPLSLALTHAMAAIFFFQPLNWVARKRLRAISELLCDQWAVDRTGRPVTLARCLATVADWSLGTRLPAPGMADPGTPLAQRIRRLLDRGAAPVRALPRGAFAALVLVLLAFAVVAPAVTARAERMGDREDRAESAREVSAAEPSEEADSTVPEEEEAFVDDEADLDEPADSAEAPEDESVVDFDREKGRTFVHRDAPEAELREHAEQMEALGRAFGERMKDLGPEIERMARDAARFGREAARMAERDALNAQDIERITRESVAEALRSMPSPEEIERLTREASRAAQIDRAEIERISREARELAEKHRPSAEEIAEIKRRAAADMARVREQLGSNEAEIREAVREALEEAREALREAQREFESDRERIAPEANRLRESGRNLGRAPRAPRAPKPPHAQKAPTPTGAPEAPEPPNFESSDDTALAPPPPPATPAPVRAARAPRAVPTPAPSPAPRAVPTPAPVAAPVVAIAAAPPPPRAPRAPRPTQVDRTPMPEPPAPPEK